MSNSPESELLHVVEEIRAATVELRKNIDGIQPNILASAAPQHKGMSLLSLKNHQMLEYLLNLVHLVSFKLAGNSIAGHPAVLRLARLRTVLERTRPIEHKLQYQIDKLLRVLSSDAKDEASFHRPRPQNLASSSEEGSGDEAGPGKKGKLYAPPKLVAMPFEEAGAEGAKEAAGKKRRLSRALMAELEAEMGDAPVEERDVDLGGRGRKAARQTAAAERTAYEEANLMRLQTTKKSREQLKKDKGRADFDSLLGFADFARAAEKRQRRAAGPSKGRKGAKGNKGTSNSKAKGKSSSKGKKRRGK